MDLLNLSPQVAGDVGLQGVLTDDAKEMINKDDLIKLEDNVVSELKLQLEKMHSPLSSRDVVKGRGVCLGLSCGNAGPFARQHSLAQTHLISIFGKTNVDDEARQLDLRAGE